ncbi:ATP-binding cassette domain-containing protein [uncultured Phascolarctobacterium sp.]|uniref:ATP-binding cassette domain-containing protein n=1 Tax=uncultured Phascolarctobacterium sp. TaxID=512296 RepID=UPI0025DB07AB|nr:ATP-binding cassette domain-containing protein [uncultured Phascolarctobacterium sp.]
MATVIQLKDIMKTYVMGDSIVHALDHVNVEIGFGEFTSIMGPSGSGKSTMMNILGCLDRPTSGEYYLDGKEIAGYNDDELAHTRNAKIGFVFQNFNLLAKLTAQANVALPLIYAGVEEEERMERAKKALEAVGLGDRLEHKPMEMSGGQRQRLALASILITKPRLLILDEPVSQMNPQGVQSFMQLLTRLNREEGIAILMIEHRVNELCRYFQRLAVMREGRIIYDGSISEAWYALTGRTDVGVREPQSVKLCRALQLPRLTASADAIVLMIEHDCAVERSACVAKQPDVVGKKILQVQDVYYTYPGAQEHTLRGVSFALHEGEITALMGFNGAGKSTLLNLLGGLTVTQRGGIMLKGQNIKKALGQVGYLRQEPDLMLLADTVREELCWKNKTLSPAALETMLQKLNLAEYADDFPLALSKGQRLRVVLGAMLAKRPALLLLDEPTTGQDEQSLGEIKQLLLDCKNNGGCALLCTHDVELAAEVADRALVLRQGQLIADSDANSVLSDERLLQEGGLTPSPLLAICSSLKLPPCVTVKEVLRYVRKTAVGGN